MNEDSRGFGLPMTTIFVSPQPELTSTSTGQASIPLTAPDKTRASMKGRRANAGARAMRFFLRCGMLGVIDLSKKL
jgi:hypothetical protein